MKNPLLNLRAVTIPRVVTAEPSSGEARPFPWMSWMGVSATSSFVIVPCPCPSATVAPVRFVTFTTKVSFASTVVSPFTVTLKV